MAFAGPHMRHRVAPSPHHRWPPVRWPKALKPSGCKLVGNSRKICSIVGSSSSFGHAHPNSPSKHEGWMSHTSQTQGGVSQQLGGVRAPSSRLHALPVNPAVLAWGQSLPAQFSAIVSRGILGATVKASVKLGLICLAVGWLLKKKLLPKETPQVLSKVTFNLCIPCMLFTKIAETLALTQDGTLVWVPIAAAIQVVLGWVIGLGAAKLLEQGAFFLPKDPNANIVTPTRAAPAIAASTATAFGNPMAAAALVPKGSTPPVGLSQLVTAACMFGNSLTLPLIFMLTLLPAAKAGPSTAYLAIFLIGWSPLFWSWGSSIVGESDESNQEGRHGDPTDESAPKSPFSILSWLPTFPEAEKFHGAGNVKKIPQSVGALMPGSRVSIPTGFHESSTSVSGSSSAGESITINSLPIAGGLSPTLSRIQDRAIRLAKQVLTPPFMAILAGCVMGVIPLGKAIFVPNGAQELASWTTTQAGSRIVNSMVSAMKCVAEVLVLFGDATVPLGAIVLASSLFVKDNRKEGKDGASESQSLLRLLIPADVFEKRALLLVSLVRFLIMPIVGITSVIALSSLGLLPADPVCRFAVLIQSVMPPAQNLTVMMNLREHTQELVPTTAKFLLRMYFLSIIGPIMLWTTIFAMNTGVQLA